MKFRITYGWIDKVKDGYNVILGCSLEGSLGDIVVPFLFKEDAEQYLEEIKRKHFTKS